MSVVELTRVTSVVDHLTEAVLHTTRGQYSPVVVVAMELTTYEVGMS